MRKRKYELTDETKTLSNGTVLHRIRAARTFTTSNEIVVIKGEPGGWVESEDNLSQFDSAWVFGEAMVYGGSRVYGSAHIRDSARVFGSACVCGEALIFGSARIFGSALVYGNAVVSGNARVFCSACVGGGVRIYDFAKISGYAQVVCSARVYDKAVVCGDAYVGGEAHIGGDARVRDARDYAVYNNIWSSGRRFTYTRSNGMWKVGCFYGTGEKLIAKAYKDSELSGRCYETIVRAQESLDREIEERIKRGGKKPGRNAGK